MAVAENDTPEFHKQSDEYFKVSAIDEAPNVSKTLLWKLCAYVLR